MLVVRVHSKEDLESKRNVIDNIARDFVSKAVEYGFARIFSYPSIDSVFASAMLVTGLQRMGISSALSITLEPPRRADVPHVVIGYSTPKTVENKGDSLRVCLSRRISEPPSPNSFCLEFDSSYGIGLAAFMQNTGIVNSDLAVLSILSPYLSCPACNPELTELERSYLDDWMARKDFEGIEKREDILLHGIDRYALAYSVHYTIEPYIPGLTGDKSTVVEELALRGLDKYAASKASEVDSRHMAELLKIIASRIQDHSKIRKDPRDLIGNIIIIKSLGVDLLTLKRLLYLMIAYEGRFDPVFRLVINPGDFIEEALRLHEEVVDTGGAVDHIRSSFVRYHRLRSYPWLNAYLIQGVPQYLLHIIGFNLRFYGFIENDALVLGVVDRDKAVTTISEVEYSRGPDLLKKIYSQMIGEQRDALVYVNIAK